MRGSPALALTAALLAGGLAACDGASADEVGLLPALCDAIAAPDGASATEVFDAEVHQPLHQLADEVAAADRAVATRLLEAKFGVETVVRGDTEVPDTLVRQRLQDLDAQVRVALRSLDRPTPDC